MYPRHQARHVSSALKVFEPVFVQIEAQGGLRYSMKVSGDLLEKN
jgi:hypothetical protein